MTFLGTNLVERLIQSQCQTRASGRKLGVLESRGWQGVELVEADALKLETLKLALINVDVAYYLVHSMATGANCSRLDRQAAENFSLVAAQAEIQRIIYQSALTLDQPVSEHLRSSFETGACLRAGKMPVTENRAGMIVVSGSAAFEIIRDQANHLPLMITPRWVDSRSTPIALDNLIDYLLQVPYLELALKFQQLHRPLEEIDGTIAFHGLAQGYYDQTITTYFLRYG